MKFLERKTIRGEDLNTYMKSGWRFIGLCDTWVDFTIGGVWCWVWRGVR